jgi:hypothetical protein
MDPTDVDGLLRRHRRRWWRPRRCRCGLPHPCGARIVALDAEARQVARLAADWYPRYFRGTGSA